MLQKLTKKKALGTGPNCALQAEYALDGNVLVTMLKVGLFEHLPACLPACLPPQVSAYLHSPAHAHAHAHAQQYQALIACCEIGTG